MGHTIISPSNACVLLHLYTQHYISILVKCQFFFHPRERFPRFYPNSGFLTNGLVKYHEKRSTNLEESTKYYSFSHPFRALCFDTAVPAYTGSCRILLFSLFPFLPCFSEKSREFVAENDTSYACGKKKPIFHRRPVSFPKTTIRREFK